MSASESTSTWIDQLRRGDPRAAQRLWEQYYEQLLQIAQRRLASWPRRVADEEDVVLAAIHSFCRAAARGRFPQLSDTDDIWHLLLAMTARKICDYQRHTGRAKRGGGHVAGEPAVRHPGDTRYPHFVEQAIAREPSPAMVVEWTESLRQLLGRLRDKQLERIALMKLEGYTNPEIAAQLDCGLRSVERKLRRIRAIWKDAASGE